MIQTVERLLAKAPQWIRQDFLSSDATARTRAEESLAAMIGAALAERNTVVASGERRAALLGARDGRSRLLNND